MRIEGVRFQTMSWDDVPREPHAGESGTAWWKTVMVGNVRARIVEYSPGYVADHWCEKGHVIHVLEGELITELADGRTFTLQAGGSYLVGDGADAHKSRSPKGAKLFIVD